MGLQGGAWDPCSSTSHSLPAGRARSCLMWHKPEAVLVVCQLFLPTGAIGPLPLFIGEPSQTVVSLAGCHKTVELSEVR